MKRFKVPRNIKVGVLLSSFTVVVHYLVRTWSSPPFFFPTCLKFVFKIVNYRHFWTCSLSRKQNVEGHVVIPIIVDRVYLQRSYNTLSYTFLELCIIHEYSPLMTTLTVDFYYKPFKPEFSYILNCKVLRMFKIEKNNRRSKVIVYMTITVYDDKESIL